MWSINYKLIELSLSGYEMTYIMWYEILAPSPSTQYIAWKTP